MKKREKLRLALCAIFYVTGGGLAVWLIDSSSFYDNYPFLLNVIGGYYTIVGGVLLAYILYEQWRIKREREARERENQTKQRVIKTLDDFKKSLLDWIYSFASGLYGKFFINQASKEIKIRSGQYEKDIPRLQDILNVGIFDPTGIRLTGTDQAEAISREIYTTKYNASDFNHSLNYALRIVGQIERELKRFPRLLEYVSPEVAEIVNLRELIESRKNEIRLWESKHEKDSIRVIGELQTDSSMITNLRNLGKAALNIVAAIDSDTKRLNSEIQN